MTGMLLLAALKTLTMLGADGGYSEDVAPEETALFERADKILAAQNGRRAKWERYLSLMGQRESRPSLAAVRYRLSVGRRVYSFTVYGRLFVDGRFVRDDEIQDVLAIERVFRAQHARSPWKGEALRDGRSDPLVLRGFEDSRFQSLDEPIARIVGEFNAKRAPKVHELQPRLFKSFVIEMAYWRTDAVAEDELRAELARLFAAGAKPDGGFRGWYAALQSAQDVDFAERVVSRAENQEVFVPVNIWKEKVK